MYMLVLANHFDSMDQVEKTAEETSATSEELTAQATTLKAIGKHSVLS